MTFDRIASLYLEYLRERTSAFHKKYARHEQSIRLHLIPFFGGIRIDHIQPEDTERWLEWRTDPAKLRDHSGDTRRRRADMSRVPARSTIQKDAVAFRAVTKHARLHLHINTTFVPSLPLNPRISDTRRPRFYPDEWALIQKTLSSRINRNSADKVRNGKNIVGGSVSQKTKWFREMIHHFVNVLHGTGLRVSEAMNLKFSSLRRVAEGETARELYREELRLVMDQFDARLNDEQKKQKEDLYVSLRHEYRIDLSPGVGLKHYGHARTVIPLRETTADIDHLLVFLWLNLPSEIKHNAEEPLELPEDLWLFCHPNGMKIKSFYHGFEEILKETGLLYRNGKKRSLTSIRHTYASERIEAGVIGSRGLKPLADNMGTSVEMLQRHYAQEIREKMAEDLQRT
jgi:integrase